MTPDGPAQVTADLVLRSLEFDNVALLDAPLPEPDPVPLELSLHPRRLLLAPGEFGTFAVQVTGLGDDERLATLRLSRVRSAQHLEVPRVSSSDDVRNRIEASFAVQAEACSRSCNERLPAELLVAVSLADGRSSVRVPLPVELDCRTLGHAELCAADPRDGPADYLAALDTYTTRLCECGLGSCDANALPFTFDCMVDVLAANPGTTAGLASCMADALDEVSACMKDEVCDPQLCGDPLTFFNLPAACGLGPGSVNDALTACVLERRVGSVFECSGLSVPVEWFCDFGFECPSGLDELACPLPIECAIDGSEVGVAWACNGVPDCIDGTDEQPCPQPR